MREIITKDIFAGARLVKKMGIKEDIKQMFESAGSVVDEKMMGMDFIMLIFERCTTEESEHDLYRFFAPIFEVSVSEIENMKFADLYKGFQHLVEMNDIDDFFSQLSRLMG